MTQALRASLRQATPEKEFVAKKDIERLIEQAVAQEGGNGYHSHDYCKGRLFFAGTDKQTVGFTHRR